MRDQLHNEIDEVELFREKVKKIIRDRLIDEAPRIINSAATIEEVFVMLADVAEDEMAKLTSEGFDMGVRFAKERSRL